MRSALRIAVAAIAVTATGALALNGGTTYPRLACYTSQADQASPATLDSLARYDLIVHLSSIRPEALARLRARNPRIRVLMELQPQYTPLCTSPQPWWLPDTLWSPGRALQWACYRNPQWLMRDTSRRTIPVGGIDYLVNWTGACPLGTRGTARGLRVSQWYAAELARICLSGRYWRPMAWDRMDTQNGVVFEILADCLGSYGHWDVLRNADPDGDGQPEGVDCACLNGGSVEPLSALMRGENAAFRVELLRRFPANFPFIINENNDGIGPAWRTQLSGMKLENWDGDTPASWRSWWYGSDLGRGYLWAERRMGRTSTIPDRLKGWDMSILRMARDSRRTPADNARRARFALGTCLLGDGWYYFDPGDEKSPAWMAEYRDIGTPTGDARVLTVVGTDTLWTRTFTGGSVRVNPSGRALLGVPAHEAVIR